MQFRCVFTLLQTFVLVGLDWAKPMMLLSLHVTCSCIFHTYVPSFPYILILNYLVFFSLSPSLSFFQFASWHLTLNLLRLETLFIPGHLPLILLLLIFSSVMRKPVRTFLDKAFIRNVKSFYRIFPILTFPLSSTAGV